MRWRRTPAPGAPPARERAMRLASRHSRMVDLLRFILPATALVLLGLVVLWPQVTGGYGNLIMPMLRSEPGVDLDAMRMQKPRYVGRTRSAEPYAVTAESAAMDPAHPNRIQLEHLAAEIARSGQRDLYLNALAGVYHRESEHLDLEGGIELTTGDGYRFQTRSAQLRLDRGLVRGQEPITGSGPAGTLAADRFEIRDGGDVLYFEGAVRVRLQTAAGGAAS